MTLMMFFIRLRPRAVRACRVYFFNSIAKQITRPAFAFRDSLRFVPAVIETMNTKSLDPCPDRRLFSLSRFVAVFHDPDDVLHKGALFQCNRKTNDRAGRGEKITNTNGKGWRTCLCSSSRLPVSGLSKSPTNAHGKIGRAPCRNLRTRSIPGAVGCVRL